jgi:malate synthase
LMEDAATAEISRAQIWQWIRHPRGRLSNGQTISVPLVRQVLAQELSTLRDNIGAGNYANTKFDEAADLFLSVSTTDEFVDFLTLPAYERLD